MENKPKYIFNFFFGEKYKFLYVKKPFLKKKQTKLIIFLPD